MDLSFSSITKPLYTFFTEKLTTDKALSIGAFVAGAATLYVRYLRPENKKVKEVAEKNLNEKESKKVKEVVDDNLNETFCGDMLKPNDRNLLAKNFILMEKVPQQQLLAMLTSFVLYKRVL